ncbi:hypothetical protein DICPUDRAFT_98573 [Dictyostelium purpureum]|uniref:Autocrine proliferation repressor A-like n=1 Tax=Dictyostelium purpureum TaxID=5786 RepID=F0ZRP6_DICPU|nr:uncharacterized protein DICPUDRAFT_98573 [Dictyostelium purpureum]EGC33378.1 hypothetical protein DICPUDRAFT_98573 [Dictyostelium purpureum]|eukprot:XP_003290086.1 hypothetical protein DICPUDRAFT_98573 [Dictyostelium purpureum]
MLKILIAFLFLITLINAESKVLSEFVQKYDPNFKWTLNATYDIGHANVHILEFRSQQWLNSSQSSAPVWKHWLQICIPKALDRNIDSAILMIEGGDIQNWAVPTAGQINGFGNKMLCSATSPITATLQQTPQQDLVFENDGVLREEDDIVAYTWAKFMNTNETDWISLNPQTKSAIRAMDAIQQFGNTFTGNYTVNKFVVTGGSKRGWTTWGTAMVKDPRVIGIAPMVISVLNLVDNIEAQIECYGNWSFALQDYVNHNITKFLYTKYFAKLTQIIDPINYIDVVESIPKLIILAVNDEFFLPDSTKFYFSQLKGETKLALFANTTHSGIKSQQVANTIVNFYNLVSKNMPIPQFKWSIDYSNDKNSGTITLNVLSGTVTKVLLYHGTTESKVRRDFRFYECHPSHVGPQCIRPNYFFSFEIQATSPNTYVYTVTKPQQGGWTGFYMNVYFSTGSIFSSEMAVVPDILPFPKCTMEVCGSGLPSYMCNNSSCEDDLQDSVEN